MEDIFYSIVLHPGGNQLFLESELFTNQHYDTCLCSPWLFRKDGSLLVNIIWRVCSTKYYKFQVLRLKKRETVRSPLQLYRAFRGEEKKKAGITPVKGLNRRRNLSTGHFNERVKKAFLTLIGKFQS